MNHTTLIDAGADSAADSATQPAERTRRSPALQRLFWRVHFWAGLITAPLLLFAACTGLLYVFTPQIEAWRHADVDRVAVGPQVVSLDRQVAAALASQTTQPSLALRNVVPARQPGDTTQVVFKPTGEHASHDHGLPQGRIVYVNPSTGAVVGELAEMDRFATWSKKLHSSALQGNSWRWLLELAASWMLVMLATGLALWWPRAVQQGGRGLQALRPRWGRGRLTWRDAHALVGLAMSVVLAVILVTGLTWSTYAGDQFKALQKALKQDSPRPPKSLQSSVVAGGAPLSWQAVAALAAQKAPEVSIQLTPPQGATGVWRVENFDRSRPAVRFNMALDAYSGEVLFYTGWNALPVMAQATAVGIPFHRGEFGWWNQALLVLAALTTLFSVVSGVVMWWLRRPQGHVAAPPLRWNDVRAVPVGLWPLAAALAYAMPVFGLSALCFLALEALRLLWPQRWRHTGMMT